MGPPPDLVARLDLSDLAQEPVWPSALITGAAHYSDAPMCDIHSPIDQALLGRFAPATIGIVQHAVEAGHGAFLKWRVVPLAQRVILIQTIRQRVRDAREALGQLLTIETGLTTRQADHEVALWLGACDEAAQRCGDELAQDAYPASAASARPSDTMWQPLGAIGILSSSRAPLSSWARHAMIALACGNTLVWKPSPKALLAALAAQRIVERAVHALAPQVPVQVCQLVAGSEEVGALLAGHASLSLIAITGEAGTVQLVATTVASHLGRCMADVHGSGAAIILPEASVHDALPRLLPYLDGRATGRRQAVQRILVHESHLGEWTKQLGLALDQWVIGDPRAPDTDCGPLPHVDAWWALQSALQNARQAGCEAMTGGERVHVDQLEDGYYIRPALVSAPYSADAIGQACGLPILFVLPYQETFDALTLHNERGRAPFTLLIAAHPDEASPYLAADGVESEQVHVISLQSPPAALPCPAPAVDWHDYTRRMVRTIEAGEA